MLAFWWIVFGIFVIQFAGWVYTGPIRKEWGESKDFAIVSIVLALSLCVMRIFV